MAHMLAIAIALASDKFKDITDKANRPYILHCLRVMDGLRTKDDELMIIAVLHDLLEDTDITVSDLLQMGFSQRVVDALSLLNHQRGVSYDVYINAVGTNYDAIRVKQSDLKDNSDISRMKGLTEKDFARMQKYQQAYAFLDIKRAVFEGK